MMPSAPPPDGPVYSIDEIVAMTGVSIRSIRNWVQRGLVPAPPFRGRATRYGREHRARIAAIKKLRGDYLLMKDVQRRLANKSLEEIERIAQITPPSALASPPTRSSASTTRLSHVAASGETADGRAAPESPARATSPRDTAALVDLPQPPNPTARWERLVLLPGLELFVRDEPLLRRVAHAIGAQFVGSGDEHTR